MTAAEPVEVIDCCVRQSWATPDEVLRYIEPGWREYMLQGMSPGWKRFMAGVGPRPEVIGRTSLLPTHPYPVPTRKDPADSTRLRTASTPEDVVWSHLDPQGITRALLCHDSAMLTPTLPNARLTVAIAQGVNDWMADTWLADAGERFLGSVLVPTQLPEAAAAEIRRVGNNTRFAAVLMAANGLGKPLGHPVYHPIYEAAAEFDLPIMTFAGAEAVIDSPTPAVAGGPAATFTDYLTLLPQTQMRHLTSLVCQGVFEKYPSLRVMVAGAGAHWAVPWLWTFDTNYKALRLDAPWLTDLPSEYVRKHVKIAGYPLDPMPSDEVRLRYLEASGGFDDLLCYASGYPYENAVDTDDVRRSFPAAWHRRLLHDNARAVLRTGASSLTAS